MKDPLQDPMRTKDPKTNTQKAQKQYAIKYNTGSLKRKHEKGMISDFILTA
jgi:hypothetical protein